MKIKAYLSTLCLMTLVMGFIYVASLPVAYEKSSERGISVPMAVCDSDMDCYLREKYGITEEEYLKQQQQETEDTIESILITDESYTGA